MPTLLYSTSIPSQWRGGIKDFDVVVDSGRPVVVCAALDEAYSWDSHSGTWTLHRLDNPWRSRETGYGIELETIAATMVDGRVVLGGGGDHQSFAAWDLRTGKVLHHAESNTPGVHSVVATRWERAAPGIFIVGESSGGGRVIIVDSLGRRPVALSGHFDYVAVAAGMLRGRPVLITDAGDEVVWNAATLKPLRDDPAGTGTTEPAPPPGGVTFSTGSCATGLVTLNDSPAMVVVNDTRDGYAEVIVCDPTGDEWSQTLPPHDDFDLDEIDGGNEMTAGFVGCVGDRPVAAASMDDGGLHLWDLRSRRALPPIEDENVKAFGVMNFRGTPCLITSGYDDDREALKLWQV